MNRQKVIGRRIRAAREAIGWSQAYLAELYGCSDAAISRIESGQVGLGIVDIEKFSRLLDQPIDYFISPEDSPPITRPFEAVLKELEVVRPIAIPIFDQEASAGPGSPIQEYAYWSPPRVAGKNIKAVRIKGECLLPSLQEGDVVFFDEDASPKDGQLVVVLCEDTLCVKRFRDNGQGQWLESNNERISLESVEIQGTVISFQRWLG